MSSNTRSARGAKEKRIPLLRALRDARTYFGFGSNEGGRVGQNVKTLQWQIAAIGDDIQKLGIEACTWITWQATVFCHNAFMEVIFEAAIKIEKASGVRSSVCLNR